MTKNALNFTLVAKFHLISSNMTFHVKGLKPSFSYHKAFQLLPHSSNMNIIHDLRIPNNYISPKHFIKYLSGILSYSKFPIHLPKPVFTPYLKKNTHTHLFHSSTKQINIHLRIIAFRIKNQIFLQQPHFLQCIILS